jgi:hypothetical protein
VFRDFLAAIGRRVGNRNPARGCRIDVDDVVSDSPAYDHPALRQRVHDDWCDQARPGDKENLRFLRALDDLGLGHALIDHELATRLPDRLLFVGVRHEPRRPIDLEYLYRHRPSPIFRVVSSQSSVTGLRSQVPGLKTRVLATWDLGVGTPF